MPRPFDTVKVDQAQAAQMDVLRCKFEDLLGHLESIPNMEPRLLAIGKTNLEQAAMWLNKAIAHGGS